MIVIRTRTRPVLKITTQPDPYPRYTRTRHCQAFHIPTMLTCLKLGMSYSLISRLLMTMMTKYFYINIAKKEKTKNVKGGTEEGRGRGRGSLTYEALMTSFS